VRDHNPQPGATAFSERYHNDVCSLQLFELLYAAQFPLCGKNLCLGPATHTPMQYSPREFLASSLYRLTQILKSHFHG
jgi:hypothetical protein